MSKRRAEISTESIFVLRLYETFNGEEHLIEIRRYKSEVSHNYVEDIGKNYEAHKDSPYDMVHMQRTSSNRMGFTTPGRIPEDPSQDDGSS